MSDIDRLGVGPSRGVGHRYVEAMNLWLDDIRPCPEGCLHARSVNEVIKLLTGTEPNAPITPR